MSKKPHILLTNDDGISASGLKHLWEALADVARISIVAPASEKSGVGLGITLYSPLMIETVAWERKTPAWKVTGTPADCVRLGLSVILEDQPDLIVSGINRGANSGRNVLYSGTVGGVIEAVLRNVPGVAFSCSDFERPNYRAAASYIASVVDNLLKHPLPQGTLLNVNFPKGNEIKGVKLARQGQGYWRESPEEHFHPEGHRYYWMGGEWKIHDEHEESDVFLLENGYATAVPIHVGELTDHSFLKEHKTRFDQFFL